MHVQWLKIYYLITSVILFIFSFYRGLTKSHIFYDAESNKWKIQSLINPDRYLETEGKMPNSVPLGTVSWETGTENSLCRYPAGYVTPMTISRCFPNKYTCDSGHCIELHQKCNTEINCEDKTDESHCSYLRIGSDYSKGEKYACKKFTQFKKV